MSPRDRREVGLSGFEESESGESSTEWQEGPHTSNMAHWRNGGVKSPGLSGLVKRMLLDFEPCNA